MTSTTTPSDEEMRKLLKPNPTPEQVVDALKQSYVKPGENVTIVRELDSYDDRNYMVEVGGGTRYLAKIHNGVESENFVRTWEGKGGGDYYSCMGSVIHLQNIIMEHLNAHGIPTSQPQRACFLKRTESMPSPASVQSLPVVSTQHSPRRLVVRLLSWVPGRTMSSLQSLPLECLADAGRFLGRMNEKLDILGDFQAANRYHAWDGKQTADLRKFVHCITDDRRKELVTSVLDAFQRELIDSGVGNKFRKGILQGDFNDANILVDNEFKVSGVIDFGDSVMSWRVLDIAVAMTYAMLSAYGKGGRGISAASAMLRGFHSVYPLTEDERKHLHLLMACRLSCSTTLGAYSYQQNPENKYLLFHGEPAWKALDLLWSSHSEQRVAMKKAIDRMFDAACSYSMPGGKDSQDVINCSDLTLPDPFVSDLLSSVRNNADNTDATPAKRRKTGSIDTVNGKPVIVFVTGNKKKLEEVKRILGSSLRDGSQLPFSITNHKVDLPELQGEPLEIAKEKCVTAANEVGGAVITEDTSLCFTALNGLPGPYIKCFLEKCGHNGLNDLLAFSQDKSAYAQTVVSFCPGPGKEVVVFDGRTTGKVVPPRGSLDFGWDPVFEPDEGKGLTYGEMSKEAKDSISHRSRAFSQLRDYFVKEQASIFSSINR